MCSQVTFFLRTRTRELVSSGLGLGSFPFHFHCLTSSSSYPRGSSILQALIPRSVRISNLFLEGPSAQLLAEGTLSIHVLVSWAASLDQYSLMIQALSWVGLVPFYQSVPGRFVVDV